MGALEGVQEKVNQLEQIVAEADRVANEGLSWGQQLLNELFNIV